MKRILLNYTHRLALPILCGVAALLTTSCTSLIPDDLDALDDDVTLTITDFTPYLGLTTVYENIVKVSNNSTLPLTINAVVVRTLDGAPAFESMEKYPVKVWTSVYTGEVM